MAKSPARTRGRPQALSGRCSHRRSLKISTRSPSWITKPTTTNGSKARRRKLPVSDSQVVSNEVVVHGAAEGAHREHLPYQRHHFETYAQQSDATNFAMWLFLLTEVMFFGGLFTAYLIYRNWYYPAFVQASHQLNIFWGTANTAVLISSSFTMAMAVWSAEVKKKSSLVLFLVITFILGLVFLGIKTIEYSEKIEKHHVPGFHYSLQSFVNPSSDPEVHEKYPEDKALLYYYSGNTEIYFF